MRAEDGDFGSTVRRAFAQLTNEDLPRAAIDRNWPVRTPGEFERLLLEHLREPGREPCLFDLVMAIEVGQRMIAGSVCCSTMSRRLQCADVGDPRRADAWKALMAVLAAES